MIKISFTHPLSLWDTQKETKRNMNVMSILHRLASNITNHISLYHRLFLNTRMMEGLKTIKENKNWLIISFDIMSVH